MAADIRMSTEPESFLWRWSRRKREAARTVEQPAAGAALEESVAPTAIADDNDVAAGAPVPSSAPSGDPVPTAELPLPPIESLDGVRSDYQAFFQQPVSDDLRRAALKKLFADPHFNQMDMLDVYVDDYTQFEPLPADLRMRLPSARDFLLDSERAALDAADAAQHPDPAPWRDSASEARDLGTVEAGQTATCVPAAQPDPVPATAVPLHDQAKAIDPPSAPAVSPGKAPAPDSTTT
jgi:hypothetical protein